MAEILVVDDQLEVRTLLSHAARLWGHTVACAASVGAAEAMLDGGRFDLVITDFRMPGRDGLELVRAVQGRDPRLPVLVYSASGDRAAMLEAGAAHYIEKPASLEVLQAAIEELTRGA